MSFVPAASELFEYFVKPPLEKRLENWRADVAQALRNLEKNQGIKLEMLQGDERFMTIVIQATAVAIRNHQREKLAALKSAIMNSALNHEFGEDMEMIFIRFIDELTLTHFLLLKFLVENESKLSNLKSYPEIYQLFLAETTTVVGQDEFRMLVSDIYTRGLIRLSQDIDDFEDIYQASAISWDETKDEMPRLIVTGIAKKFLEFISYSHRAKL